MIVPQHLPDAFTPCALKSIVYYLWVQLMPQQKGTVTRPQMTLAQPPVMTLQGSSHSRIIVGQLQTGVSSTFTHVPDVMWRFRHHVVRDDRA